jgi:hypothetical protein
MTWSSHGELFAIQQRESSDVVVALQTMMTK